RRHSHGGRFHGRSFRAVREHLSFSNADRGFIRSGRCFLYHAGSRLGAERLPRRLRETEGGLLRLALLLTSRCSKSKLWRITVYERTRLETASANRRGDWGTSLSNSWNQFA